MLEDLQKNFVKLASLYEMERQAREAAESALSSAQTAISAERQKNAALIQEMENMKLAQAFAASSVSSVDAKAKIAELIRQIDRCISLLEK